MGLPPQYWNAELDLVPWAQLQERQAERLGASIASIAASSSFYAGKISAARAEIERAPAGAAAVELLRQLPFTTKDELREAFDDSDGERILGANQAAPNADIVQLVSSSGTSGSPVYYGLTARDVERWADGVANTFFTAGIRPEDVVIHLTGLPMVAGGLAFADGFRRIGATLAWMGGYTPERVLNSVPGIGGSCLSATTSFLLYLTENCERLTGRHPSELGVRKLLGGGEPGLGDPETREQLRQSWGPIDIREIMGLSDIMAGLWAECDAHDGMHFTGAGQVFIELIDESGQPLAWEQGAVGEVVYTSLGRDATPLIRFRSGDHIVVDGVGCRCGRGTPRMHCLGRIDDMLIYKGMNVFPAAIRDVAVRAGGDAVTANMRVWREHSRHVRFDDPIPLEIETSGEPDDEAAAALCERIATEVRKQLQVRVAVSLVGPGSIPNSGYKASLLHTAGDDSAQPASSPSQ